MAEYIERKAAIKAIQRQYGPNNSVAQNRLLALAVHDVLRVAAADVAQVRHGRCPVCSGQEVLAQDCDNGYSVEIDAESQEMTLWNGDTCLAAISVDYCPVCGAKMDGAE